MDLAICNPKPLLPDINVHTKFEENLSKTTQVKSLETTFLHQSEDIEEKHIFTSIKAIILCFIYKLSPFAIPNHSSPISMSMQSLKKIGKKLLKLESGNEALTDGQTLKISKILEGIT